MPLRQTYVFGFSARYLSASHCVEQMIPSVARMQSSNCCTASLREVLGEDVALELADAVEPVVDLVEDRDALVLPGADLREPLRPGRELDDHDLVAGDVERGPAGACR